MEMIMKTREITSLSLYAALITLSIQFFRIPVGPQFIHFGNALVIVGFLLFGTRKGYLAAAIGLATFDLLNGYAAEIWIILLEALVVALVVHLIYYQMGKGNDSLPVLLSVGAAGAVTKIILNLFKYTILTMLAGNTTVGAALTLAATKIIGTFGSSLATLIAVPILYPLFKQIIKK